MQATDHSRPLRLVRALGTGLLDLIFPRVCQFCRSRDCQADTPFVCTECTGRLERVLEPRCGRCGLPVDGAALSLDWCGQCSGRRWYFDRAVAALRYRGQAREMMHRFKYGGQEYWKKLIGRLMAETFSGEGFGVCDLVVPVPLHPRRERRRRYNQAALLAAELARHTGREAMAGNLLKARDTASQTELDRTERFSNQQDAYRLADPGRLRGRVVCLVDDVYTTGATARECAKLLVNSGVKKVLVLTGARG